MVFAFYVSNGVCFRSKLELYVCTKLLLCSVNSKVAELLPLLEREVVGLSTFLDLGINIRGELDVFGEEVFTLLWYLEDRRS